MAAPSGQQQTAGPPLAGPVLPTVSAGDFGAAAAAGGAPKRVSLPPCGAIKDDTTYAPLAVLPPLLDAVRPAPPPRRPLLPPPPPPIPNAPDASRPDGSQLAALCASLPESIDLSLLTSGRGVEVALSPLGTLPPVGGTRRAWPNGWTEPADLLGNPDGAADDDEDDDDETSLSRLQVMRSSMAAAHRGAREGGVGAHDVGAAPLRASGVGALAHAAAGSASAAGPAGPCGADGAVNSPPSSGRSSTGGGSSSSGGGMPLPPTGKVIARGRPATGRGGASGGAGSGGGGGSQSSRTDRRKRERAAQLEREVTALLTRLMQLHDETSRIEEGNLRLLESLMQKNRNKAL